MNTVVFHQVKESPSDALVASAKVPGKTNASVFTCNLISTWLPQRENFIKSESRGPCTNISYVNKIIGRKCVFFLTIMSLSTLFFSASGYQPFIPLLFLWICSLEQSDP